MLVVGDYLPVEIAGVEIGDAIITEINDDYIEVSISGNVVNLPPDVLDYFELWHSLKEGIE